MMGTLWKVLTRRKRLDAQALQQTKLARVLDVYDLTALGVGSTLGVGVYVLAGQVARNSAGPAVVLSFLLAAIASVFAGLCYAEFGARVPRAGSAYTYSYVSMGEFIAFIIGWNLILEYVIGAASVVRGLSMYLDSMMNDTMKTAFTSFAPINVSILSTYFDFFAFLASLLLAVVLAVGVKESSYMNSLFTLVNIAVILFVIIAGSVKADASNWRIRQEDIPANVTGGEGGFLPFGVAGVIKGAATCFYGFVGFDCIATTGEEVKKPQRVIPLAIIMSLVIVFLSYFGISTVLTMMVPYYLQDEDAPIPYVFMSVGWPVAKWIVTIGGVFGLCASLFGSMFPLPRIIYAMATDGLLFRFLGSVNSRLHTPLIATLLAGLLTGLMGGLFELSHLVNMMSIGTLLAYTIVAACVLLLRYNDSDIGDDQDGLLLNDTSPEKSGLARERGNTFTNIAKQLFNISRVRSPSPLTSNLVVFEVSLFCVMCVVTSQSIIQLMDYLTSGNPAAITVVALEVFVMCLTVVSITAQPKSARHLPFKVPLVPLLPALSIFINVYLMMMLDVLTWIRFAVWMAIGVVFYLIFGSWKSEEKNSGKTTSVECATKIDVGHINDGYVSSETSSDPEASPEASPKTNKSVYNDDKPDAAPHRESNHVAPTSVDCVVKENHAAEPQQARDQVLGRPEKEDSVVPPVDEPKRSVKQNVRVFGGDSIRSYMSVRDGAVSPVRGGGVVVFTSAYVPSECACLDSATCEHVPLRSAQPKDEDTITVIPGLQVSPGDGGSSSEEQSLYPNIIVLPFGAERTAEGQNFNESSDHENSGDSPDSEEYCTPEADEPEDSTDENYVGVISSSQVNGKVVRESEKQSDDEPKLLPPEDLQEKVPEVNDSAEIESDIKKESQVPAVVPQKDSELLQGTLRSSSFTEKLNTLLKKQHNTKAKQLQANRDVKNEHQRTQLVAKTESNLLNENLHEKVKRTPSVDSRNIDVSLSIKDRLEMLLSQRIVGTISQPDISLGGKKQIATASRTKSKENVTSSSEVETGEERHVPETRVIPKENFNSSSTAKENEKTKPPETETYTKDELKAKLEDIFSKKQRSSLKTRPETTETEITSSNIEQRAGRHKLLMEELISTTGNEVAKPNVKEVDITETIIATDLPVPGQKVSDRNEFPSQKQDQNVEEHLEDSDNSEIYFDALSPDEEHINGR